MNRALFIPCYMTFLIKSLSNINLHAGTIQIKYTLVMRISKQGVPDEIMDHIRGGILLRINEEPLSIDDKYTSKVIKENDQFYIVNIRDKMTIEFSVKLLCTPFDRFTIPLKIELTSKECNGVLYRFNCHLNK